MLLESYDADMGRKDSGPLYAAILAAYWVSAGLAANPHYQFSYGVVDSRTGDVKQHSESRVGGAVRGSYSLLEPGGTTRIVHYTADDIRGFTAVVQRGGHQVVNAAATPTASSLGAAFISSPDQVQVSAAQPADHQRKQGPFAVLTIPSQIGVVSDYGSLQKEQRDKNLIAVSASNFQTPLSIPSGPIHVTPPIQPAASYVTASPVEAVGGTQTAPASAEYASAPLLISLQGSIPLIGGYAATPQTVPPFQSKSLAPVLAPSQQVTFQRSSDAVREFETKGGVYKSQIGYSIAPPTNAVQSKPQVISSATARYAEPQSIQTTESSRNQLATPLSPVAVFQGPFIAPQAIPLIQRPIGQAESSGGAFLPVQTATYPFGFGIGLGQSPSWLFSTGTSPYHTVRFHI